MSQAFCTIYNNLFLIFISDLNPVVNKKFLCTVQSPDSCSVMHNYEEIPKKKTVMGNHFCVIL